MRTNRFVLGKGVQQVGEDPTSKWPNVAASKEKRKPLADGEVIGRLTVSLRV